MVKKHLKTLAAPKTWPIKRRKKVFTTRPSPGPHSLELSIPLNVILKDILKYATTSKEVRRILENKSILVDGKRRKNVKFPVGIFDTLTVDEQSNYLVLLNKKGKIDFLPIDKEDTKNKVCKIIGKTTLGNKKLQLNLSDGRNIISDKDTYKVGDSVIISLPDNIITKHLKQEKNAVIFLIGGKHTGQIGSIEAIKGSKVIYKTKDGESIETLKDYAYVIGKEKPEIKLFYK